MKCSVRALSILVCLSGAVPIASAQWTTVAPGIEYRQFVLTAPDPAPNNVFVTRMDRNNANCIIESSLPSGQLRTGRQVVSGMATHYDDSINYWGEEWGKRSQVVAAINGDGFTWNGVGPTGGQITSGWSAWRWPEYSQSGFVWKLDRSCFLGGNVRNGNTPGHTYQFIFFAGGGNAVPTSVNKARSGGSELIVYTPQFAEHTYTDNTGTEVVIEMTRPIVPLPVGSASYVEGTIRQIRQNAGSTPIPFDHVVLSGTGSYASVLTGNCNVGDVIRFQFEIKDYGTGGHVPTNPADWTKAYASIGCFAYVLKNGIVPVNDWSSNTGAIIRNPRTAVAFNNDYVFFIVCDGRAPGVSVGMTYAELGNFCLNKLGATWATNQDGGGSSALWVNGQIKNVPSDGSQRPVANGLLMVVVQPKVQSATLVPAQLVTTNANANVRQGPGTNYGSFWTAPSGTQGQVVEHALNGVQAKGYNWWKINFNGTVGWVAQTLLTPGPIGPSITAHPSPQTVMVGGTATFTIGATGDAPLSYRWQKNSVNLNNGGHYSGVTTATLNVLNADINDVGAYRCVVTNPYGSATSNAAALTLTGQPVITQHPTAQNVCTGGTAQFTIAASSATPATYQWQKDNANVGDGPHFAGATTPTLTVINASAGQVGSYRCVVTNAAGSVPSNQAPLTLDGAFAVVAIGGTGSSISGVSTDGAVVAGNNGSGGFIWSVVQGLRQIGGSTAGAATQGSSVIVGGMNGGAASRWNGTLAGVGSWTALPLESGTNAWTALCTSASGSDVWIGGNSGTTTGARKAVRYKQSSASTAALALPPNGNRDAFIYGISDVGSYAGRYQYGNTSPSGSRQAMGGGTLTALSPLVGSPSTSNEGVANCISRDGTKAGGWSNSASASRQGTLWTLSNPGSPFAIPFIGTDNYCELQALNSDGTVACGYGRDLAVAGSQRAIIWDAANGTRDLKSWLTTRYGLDMTGWVLTDVKGMSGDGKVIAGNGTYNGVSQAWVALLGVPGQAPTISQHPAAQTLCPGGDATFTVAATGLGTLSYQWQRDGENLADGARYSGALSPQLTVSGVSEEEAGSYQCLVAVGCSTSLSNAAVLTVRTGTSVSGQPLSRNACVGTTVQLTVSATGEGTLTYQWRKGGEDLADEGRFSGTTSATLTIADLLPDDAGSYDCVITAACGPATTLPAVLTVSTPVGLDLDDDCDVDVDDFTLFIQCAGNASVAPGPNCATRDFDGDSDIDMDDFGVFQRCYSGAGNPAPEGCAD